MEQLRPLPLTSVSLLDSSDPSEAQALDADHSTYAKYARVYDPTDLENLLLMVVLAAFDSITNSTVQIPANAVLLASIRSRLGLILRQGAILHGMCLQHSSETATCGRRTDERIHLSTDPIREE